MSNRRILVSEEKTAVVPWWRCALLWMVSGFAWVVSIPLLLLTIGGAMQPHLGWTCAVLAAMGMFSILVQVDQRLAAGAVFLVSFSSAFASQKIWPFFLATVATWLTSLNGRKRVCNPNQELLDFQYSHYSGEVHGDLDSLQQRSFFACHPHGVLSIGFISNVCWGRKFHEAVGRCFYLIDPTLRDKGLLAKLFLDAFEGQHGGFRNTRTHTIEEPQPRCNSVHGWHRFLCFLSRLMQKGESMAMIPGAYQEATAFSYGRERVALSRRKGFVKCAMCVSTYSYCPLGLLMVGRLL
eukprot:symbB.v1.2.021468.t1/scaffold1792.1/size124732/3